MHFANALRSIRNCLRTPENRRENLQLAERRLIEALKEDDQLGYVYYNLGVVFTELRRLAEAERDAEPDGVRANEEAKNYWNAAERAFRRQIMLMPNRWEAYYALALTYESREPTPQWDYVLKRCDRVIAMECDSSTRAKALLLKSEANESQAKQLADEHESELTVRGRKAEQVEGELRHMIRHREQAIAEAWAGLCSAELFGGDVAAAGRLAASALKELAVAYRDMPSTARDGDRRKARHLLERACKLSRHDAEIWFELGCATEENGDRESAIRHIDEALRIDPGQRDYWARLARLHAAEATKNGTSQLDEGERRHAEYCAEQALLRVDCYAGDGAAAGETLQTVAAAYRDLGNEVLARRVEAMTEVAELCAEFGAGRADQLPASLSSDGDGDWNWAAAQAAAARGRRHLEAARRKNRGRSALSRRARQRYEQARDCFKEAIGKLEQEYPEEVERLRLRIDLAEALRKLGEYDAAFETLRRAIGDNPLHSGPREALAEAYLAIGDYAQAARVLDQALLWNPDNPALHRKLGHCRRILAADLRRASERKRALRKSMKEFMHAQRLSEHHQLKARLESDYWLARLHKELGDYERAIPFLRRAMICSEAKPLVNLLLGEAYVRAHAYDLAENELESAIAEARSHPPTTDYGTNFNDSGWQATRVVAQACALRALAYAERGVRLDDGEEIVKEGREAASRITVKRHEAEGALDLAAGLILLKHDGPTVGDAIGLLRSSLGHSPQSETYAYLGQAYLIQAEAEPAEAARAIRRGVDACHRAIELDVTGRYSALARALLAELQAAKARLEPAVTVAESPQPPESPPPPPGGEGPPPPPDDGEPSEPPPPRPDRELFSQLPDQRRPGRPKEPVT
jgi:tetratricopeptide (TPR) repeat protein